MLFAAGWTRSACSVEVQGLGGQPAEHRPADLLDEQAAESRFEIVDVLAGGRNQLRLVEAEAPVVLVGAPQVVDAETWSWSR